MTVERPSRPDSFAATARGREDDEGADVTAE